MGYGDTKAGAKLGTNPNRGTKGMGDLAFLLSQSLSPELVYPMRAFPNTATPRLRKEDADF